MNTDEHGFRCKKWIFSFCLGVLLTAGHSLFALENWEASLSRMPLRTNVVELNKTNCAPLLLASFQENETAKALIFMPGATDELYFFNRVRAVLTNRSPTLLDAIVALTNQTLIHVTFQSPFVLLHSSEDPLQPLFQIEHEATAERIRRKKFVKHALYNDRDWDFLVPVLTFQLDTKFLPAEGSADSWHFYRHSFAGWNLTAWEALEAVSLAGKTTFVVQKRKVTFLGDTRYRTKPPVPLP
jgi:hypothetical protein